MLTSIVAVIQGTKPDLEFIVNSLFSNCDGTVLVCDGVFYTGVAVSVFKLTGI